MRLLPNFIFLSITVLSIHAMEPLQEQTPLGMTTPNTTNDKSIKWIPLTSNLEKNPTKNTKTASKTIDESIKNQIQKKIQTLLKPPKDEETDQ